MLYKKITDAASHLPTTAYRRRHANGRIRLFEAFNAKAAKPCACLKALEKVAVVTIYIPKFHILNGCLHGIIGQ